MKRQKRAEMIKKVDEWRQSSMSVETFAKTSGIPKSTFNYWVRKVRDKAKPADAFPGFIEMQQSVPIKPIPEAKTKTDILAKSQIVSTFPSRLCLKMVCIGKEITEELDFTPAKLYINRFIRRKYITKEDEYGN